MKKKRKDEGGKERGKEREKRGEKKGKQGEDITGVERSETSRETGLLAKIENRKRRKMKGIEEKMKREKGKEKGRTLSQR